MNRQIPPASVVYVANADTQDISLFDLGPEGNMSVRDSVAVQRPVHLGRSIVMALSPERDCLYAAHLSGPDRASVSAYSIDPRTGSLRLIGVTPLPDASAYLSTDRSGRFLLSASYAGSKVSINAIEPGGLVGELLQVVDTAPKAHCILTDPSNRFALYTSLGGDLIYQGRFDADTGRLSPNEPAEVRTRPKAGPRFAAFAPGADRVYVINELDGSVDVYPFDPVAGTLGPPVQTVATLPSTFAGQPWGGDLRFRPDGRFVYVSERTTSMLTAFEVDEASGKLTRVDAYPTVRQPRSFAIDPSGSHLVSAGQLSHTVALYLIDAATGELIRRREYAVGRNPTWVEIIALR
ncbi:MAG: beta-propeller fold lactonase family protein [Gammaproteobacteria bacterium]|nr:beta-propeller fold lactonase family protein [Gammaproteobacteria bacterium]